MRRIRILVLDNQALIREGVRTVLERHSDLVTVAEAGTLDEAVRCGCSPDVVVAEPLLAGDRPDREALVRELVATFQDSGVLLLSQIENLSEIEVHLASGARGYILKKALSSELVEAVRRVADGEEYLQPALGAALLKGKSRHHTDKRSSRLTSREREVLRVLALGHTNAETAEILSYAVRTVEGYRSRIMQKLEADSRAELVKAASELNLLHFEQS